jgi:hypothetical protein
MRVVKREETPELDVAYVQRLAEEFIRSKETQASIEKRTNSIKAELTAFVESAGVPDDKGHLWLTVGDMKLKRERRVSRSLDTQAAQNWAVENGHWDSVKQTIEILDEDKLLGLAWSNKELEDEIQSFYIEKESWAFKV